MKLFKVSRSWRAGEMDTTILYAENKEKAKEIIIDLEKEYDHDEGVIFISEDPYTLSLSDDERWANTYCRVEEVECEEGIIYTGYFCC